MGRIYTVNRPSFSTSNFRLSVRILAGAYPIEIVEIDVASYQGPIGAPSMSGANEDMGEIFIASGVTLTTPSAITPVPAVAGDPSANFSASWEDNAVFASSTTTLGARAFNRRGRYVYQLGKRISPGNSIGFRISDPVSSISGRWYFSITVKEFS